ncbi:MAG: hypothetical protein ABW217_02405 [Polyangiaceae bacterium]
MGTHTAYGTDRIPHRGTTSALALHASASSFRDLTTLEQRLDSALVPARGQRPPVSPRQLSWNGVRVSEQMQRYAADVARGAALAPYRGPVLARSETVFPWNLEATPLRAQRRHEDPAWSIWQLAVLALLFAGVVFGGGASLLADSDGAELPHWSTAMLEPRVAEPTPTTLAAPAEQAALALSTPRPTSTRAAPASQTVRASTRSVSATRAPARARTRAQQSKLAAGAAAEDNALFVEAPSF